MIEECSGQVVKENKLLKEEVVKLRNELKIQRESTNDLEQYIRRDCIEISGIPEDPLENTNEIVIKVADLMGVEIDSSDISVSHRLPKKPTSYSSAVSRDRRQRESKIIAKFVRRDVRDEFYRGRKRLSNKTTRDLGFSDQSGNRIYINENLSPNNKRLFHECLKLKREMEFKFIWTHYGRIFLRKDANSPAKTVSNDKDLELISRISSLAAR